VSDTDPSPTLPGITLGDLRVHGELSGKLRARTIEREELETFAVLVAREKEAAAKIRNGTMYVSLYRTIQAAIDAYRTEHRW
jgi:hypothetical protein